ncbi:MAG TPA: hypothetical protein VI455_10260 [Terriglobia bacterium]
MKTIVKTRSAVVSLVLTATMVAWAPRRGAAQVSELPSAQSIFQVVPTPNENFENELLAASASAPNDIWAVGQSTIHFDGTKWTAFPAPMIKGDNTSQLGGVADISPTEAWAVGTVNIGLANPGQVIERWNGQQWSVFPGPHFQSGDQPSLTAMATISPDDIWAVGDLLADGGELLEFLFEHWDGTSWTATTLGSPDAFLFGASADATNDAWAVGFSGFENESSSTVTVHWDGTEWAIVSSPNVGQGANQLNAVLALAPDDAWAVGFSTPVPQAATLTLIEHWDGVSWTVVPSPNVGPNSGYQSNRLLGITAVSSTDVWAFGSYFAANGSGHQMTLLLHWDGDTWSIVPSPNPTRGGFLSDLLWAGVVPSPDNVWIVGAEDEAPHEGTLAIHATTGSQP